MVSPSARVMAWAAAWESGNPDKLAALYARDATHASAYVSHLYPEANASVLKGRDQVREYARRGMARFTSLRFEIVSVVESENSAAVEYLRHSALDTEPKHVLELIEWERERIKSVRVFHF